MSALSIIHFNPSEELEETISQREFLRELPFLDRCRTRKSERSDIAYGFSYFTDFLKHGSEFFRVCHDAPECPEFMRDHADSIPFID